MTLSEYVENGGRAMAEEDVAEFRKRDISALILKMGASESEMQGRLLRLTQFLLRIAVEYDDYRRTATTSDTTREAVFVLRYFLDPDDAIPDAVEDLGLKDDWMVARAMVRRRAGELREFAQSCGFVWDW